MRNGTTIAIFIALLFPAASGPACSADATVARLENGLRVVLIENHGSPMIASTAIVGAGADWETAATAGASHMLEHLLFNGTERRTQKELYDETDYFGIYSNATTRRSHTVYFVLAAAEHVREALDIQEDMLFHSILPKEKFEKERGIVIEEIGKDEQSPSSIEDRLFRATAFRGSPYGREVLGSRATIRALSRQDVFDYYSATYAPNNMTLLLTGDFRTDEMLDLVRKKFGANAGKPLVSATIPDPPPLPARAESHIFHDTVERGYLSIAFDAPTLLSDDTFLYSLVVELLRERLNEEFVLAESPRLSSVTCSYEKRASFGRLVVSASFDAARDPVEVEKMVVAGIDRFKSEGVSADRLRRYVVSRRTGDIYMSEKLHYYGMMKAEDYALGGQEGLDRVRRLLETAGPETINDGARKLLKTGSRVSTALLPGDRNYKDADITIHVPNEKNLWEAASGVGFFPGSFEIISRPARAGGDGSTGDRTRSLVDTTFANGLRLLVDSNDDSEVFALHLLARNRSWNEPEGKGGIADFVHRLLPRGTAGRDAAEVRAALDRIGAELKVCDASFIPYDDYYTTPGFSFIRFTTIDEFADNGLALLADLVSEPSLSAADVETIRKAKLATAIEKGETPSNLSRAVLFQNLYRNHPLSRAPEGTPETIREISHGDITAFHRHYFAPDNLVLSVVTSIPSDRVVREIGSTFGSWERSGRSDVPLPELQATRADTLITHHRGASQSYIRTAYTLPVPYGDQAALSVAVSILSGDIAFDLRETQGLAYSIGAGVSFRGEMATLSAGMGTGPENVDAALLGIRQYLDRAVSTDEIDEKAVVRTVNSLVGRDLMRRLSRPSQAFRLGLRSLRDDRTDWAAELRDVTADDVIRVSNQYIRSAPSVCVLVR